MYYPENDRFVQLLGEINVISSISSPTHLEPTLLRRSPNFLKRLVDGPTQAGNQSAEIIHSRVSLCSDKLAQLILYYFAFSNDTGPNPTKQSVLEQ